LPKVVGEEEAAAVVEPAVVLVLAAALEILLVKEIHLQTIIIKIHRTIVVPVSLLLVDLILVIKTKMVVMDRKDSLELATELIPKADRIMVKMQVEACQAVATVVIPKILAKDMALILTDDYLLNR
jgi:hypothetical protein